MLKLMDDYVVAIDTDSLYIRMDDFCEQRLGKEVWKSKTDKEKVNIIDEISECINDYINEKVYNTVQLEMYNSTVEDFRIKFAKEKIAKSGLFIAKKMYSVRCLWIEGDYVDKISTTGLTIVRGDSSEAIRYRLKDIMYMIMNDLPEKDIQSKISKYKKELQGVNPEELAANIGVSHINKWLSKDDKAIKRTPWHVKGAINYRHLLETLKLEDKYEEITEGMKVKVVYIKANPYNMETISFYKWPKEFEEVIQVDKEKMIEKFFLNKVGILLEPMNKLYMISLESEEALDLFFS